MSDRERSVPSTELGLLTQSGLPVAGAETALRAVRVSRCVRDRVAAGCRGTVLAVHRRTCHLAVDGAPLLILTRPGVPLAPNAVTVDVGSHSTLEDRGFRVGQAVALGGSALPDRDVDWRIACGVAATWEPRPRIHPVGSRELIGRWGTTRTNVIADGAGESLLPLLWVRETNTNGLGPGLAQVAEPATRLLCRAAIRGDARALARAARGLAGLGPGLTPSGDDLLAGFAAAWTLVGAALGRHGAACERVTEAIVAGAERGASPLGRVWLEHARRGELLEPMTLFVAALLAPEPRGLDQAVRGVLTVGSSSGTDWMVGFLLGSWTLLDGSTPRRPW